MKTRILLLLLAHFLFIIPMKGQDHISPSELKKMVENAYETFQPTGLSVAIIKDGKTIVSESYGKRSAETGKPVTNQSIYSIASCTKPFTASAIGILVQQGKIDWKDKVIEYIPEFTLNDPYITRHLTIADLLSHRSGLSTFTGDLLWYHTNYSNEQIIERMEFLPIENEFRTEFGYQNNMFMIAGEIIERVTGQTWSEFITEHFFEPLDMEATTPSNDEIQHNSNIAHPHLNGEQVKLYDFKGTKPAASIMSNTEDLGNWLKMLLNDGIYNGDTILTPQILEECFAPRTNRRVSNMEQENGTNFRAYGLGWEVFDFHGKKVIQHDGGMPGYISKTTIIPDAGLGIVVLNNGFDFFVHRALLKQILDTYFAPDSDTDWIKKYGNYQKGYAKRKEKKQQKRLESRIENTTPSLEQQLYTGTYKDKMYGTARVEEVNNQLKVTLMPARDILTSKMKHWHYDTFRVDFKDPFLPFGLVTFDFNSEGAVKGFKIDLPSNDFHFKNLYFKKIVNE